MTNEDLRVHIDAMLERTADITLEDYTFDDLFGADKLKKTPEGYEQVSHKTPRTLRAKARFLALFADDLFRKGDYELAEKECQAAEASFGHANEAAVNPRRKAELSVPPGEPGRPPKSERNDELLLAVDALRADHGLSIRKAVKRALEENSVLRNAFAGMKLESIVRTYKRAKKIEEQLL